MAHVRIYTTTYCGYCSAAKRYLKEVKGVAFEEIDAADPETRQWLRTASGQTTVPQIFIGERAIGGYTDMRALDAAGELDGLLAARGTEHP